MGVDDKQFLSNISSFLTTTKMHAATSNSNPLANGFVEKMEIDLFDKKNEKKITEKMDANTIDSKLEKLRSKYGKDPKIKAKKAPIFVEPHQDQSIPTTSKTEGTTRAQEVLDRMR